MVTDDLVLNPGSWKVWEMGGRAQGGPKCRTFTLAVLLGAVPSTTEHERRLSSGFFGWRQVWHHDVRKEAGLQRTIVWTLRVTSWSCSPLTNPRLAETCLLGL